MANSITLTGEKHNSRYFELVCTQKSNGSDKNTSTITWTLYAKGDSVFYSTGPTAVVINGKTVYSKDRVSWETGKFPVAQGSVSGTLDVAHNADGTKKIDVKFSTAIELKKVVEYSDTWTLDGIPRYATAQNSLSARTETTVSVNWSSDSTIDVYWYSINNGTNWRGPFEVNAKNGAYVISSLSANTAYKIKTRVRRKDSQLTTDSNAIDVTTYDYPHCTESPDFTIGNPVTLKFYNPLRRNFTFQIKANGTLLTSIGLVNGETTHTGLNSDAEQTQFYNTIPNATSGTYEVITAFNGVEKTRSSGNKYYINEMDCTPKYGAFTYRDGDNATVGITSNDHIFVKSYSQLYITIPSASKATAKNGATIKKYVITCDTLRAEKEEINGDIVVNLGSIKSAGIKRISVRAYDSRDISVLDYKDIVVQDYDLPFINVDAQRLNNFESQTTIKVNGNYSRLTINGTDKNHMVNVYYKIREKGGSWGGLLAITTYASNGEYHCDDLIIPLDNSKEFEIEIQAKDELGNALGQYATLTVNIDVGQSIFFVSTNQKACYINGQKILMYDVIDTWGAW